MRNQVSWSFNIFLWCFITAQYHQFSYRRKRPLIVFANSCRYQLSVCDESSSGKMLPSHFFLFSALLIAGNIYVVLGDAGAELSTVDCVQECPEYEVYSECGNNGCQNTCANPNIALVCRATCIAGCICAEGLLRNSKGACVDPKDCDTCKANEVFSPCGNHGCLNTCLEPDLITRCDYLPGCYPGCICDEGFLRDPSGNCIPEKNCTCGVNEVYSETGKWICENTCAQPTKSTVCKAKAEPGCGCKEGYLRNKNQVCVLPESCDEGCNGDPNAFFAKCGDPSPVTCNNMDKLPPVSKDCIVGGGCKCKIGFVKNINGICIKASDCPKCGANEVFACGSACDTTCATLGDTCPIINISCNDMCYCVDGYARNNKNVCIPIKQCPPKFNCSKTQVYNACPDPCSGLETCQTYILGISPACSPPSETRVCKPKCECKSGLLLKSEKECVKPEQCCEDPNAGIVSCPNPCPGGTCESPEFADCKAPCRVRGCQCKSGFVKDSQGKCIELSKCPNRKCPANEVYNACPGYCTFDKTCPMLIDGIIPDCASPPEEFPCNPRCECKEGFVRIGSACVPPENCCEDSNSELVSCPNPCPGGTCDQPEFSICKVFCKEKGCQCKKGFVKDGNGKCIPVNKCPPKCKANEQYKECGTRCPPTCDNRNPICTKDCATGCFCVDGYIRQNGVCIPVKDCPPKCTKVNEVYKQCGTRCPPTCDNRFPFCTKECFPGCACKDGYILQNGTCILIANCPKTPPPKTCYQNEEYAACPPACPAEPTCTSLLALIQPECSSQSVPGKCNPSCRCKAGYVRNDQKLCVLPGNCCTDPNSELIDNPNCCPGGTCASPKFIPCKRACPSKGCQCKKGFVKKSDTDSKCIAESACCKTPTVKK